MDTGCIGKKISAISNIADSSFLVHRDFLYDSIDEECPCTVSLMGPLVIEFEDGTNIAFSIFRGPIFGIKKNFTGKYEGDGKPNIDARIIFKNMIGKCFTKVELDSFPLNEDSEDDELGIKVFPAENIPDETVANVHLYLDDGTIFEIKEYGAYDLLEADKSMSCVSIIDFWRACDISEIYAQ